MERAIDVIDGDIELETVEISQALRVLGLFFHGFRLRNEVSGVRFANVYHGKSNPIPQIDRKDFAIQPLHCR